MNKDELIALLAQIASYILKNYDIEPDATLSEMLERLNELEGS